jgi:hypothetical protein
MRKGLFRPQLFPPVGAQPYRRAAADSPVITEAVAHTESAYEPRPEPPGEVISLLTSGGFLADLAAMDEQDQIILQSLADKLRIEHTDARQHMPRLRPPNPEERIQFIRRWIGQGCSDNTPPGQPGVQRERNPTREPVAPVACNPNERRTDMTTLILQSNFNHLRRFLCQDV